MSGTYSLLLGSVGDDSHSVGMILLEIAFREAGFIVKNIGILNSIDDFFYRANNFDAIFISCMNGHSNLYLNKFLEKLNLFQLSNHDPKAWYLGGNLSMSESDESVKKKYLNMGFDFVAPKPLSVEVIMKNLEKDFFKKGIKKRRHDRNTIEGTLKIPNIDSVNDYKMSDFEFSKLQKEVLESWPTGKEVYDADIKKNHSVLHKNLHNLILRQKNTSSLPLIQPRTGVAHIEDEINILKYLHEFGLNVSSIQLDAACRKKMYSKAEEGVLKTEIGKVSQLNGYPVPIHGVKGIKKIIDAIDTPFQIRAGSPDHRLSYEIGLAGGASALEGGFLCYLYPYDKMTSPVESLNYWKYIDKLTEKYSLDHGIIINREYFGPLTCCLLEPTIPISINIIQSILSAKCGVQCISVGIAEQGNRIQDIAAVRVLKDMTSKYLTNYGFKDCMVSVVYHHYMAAFPTDRKKARDLIVNSSITGTLSKANRIMTKTPVESIHIPTKEDNAEGLRLTKEGMMKAKDTHINWGKIKQEIILIERQVTSVINLVEILGQGSIAKGAIRAFEKGVLDIPFSPSKYNKNKLITARDSEGKVRFVNPEILPFADDIVDFHKQKIQERMITERISKVYQIIDKDLSRIWKNDYLGWPLDKNYIY